MVLGYRVLVLLAKLVTLGKTHSSPEQAGMHVATQVPSFPNLKLLPLPVPRPRSCPLHLYTGVGGNC